MLDQFKSFAVTNLVKKLNEHGINVDPQTVEKAINNSPQLIVQIQGILLASDSKQRIEKIKELLNQAASGQTTSQNQTK